MKRILLACFLFTATCSITQAQTASETVSKSSFTARVKQLDTYIGQSKMTEANATFQEINKMMMSELGIIKMHIANASSETEKTEYMSIMRNQQTLYSNIYQLKADMTTNRTAIGTKLAEFSTTIK